MRIVNFRLFQGLKNDTNTSGIKAQLRLIIVTGLISLGVGFPVLAERQRDVERLISTNQCQQCDLSQANLADAKLGKLETFD